MPNEQPLLTIAIPTYNRSKYLAQLLTVLAPQVSNESRVELIISDNASSDNTAEVVREFLQSGLKARYIRNLENVGADANILQCFEKATGKYVWILGDDDVVIPDGLPKILDYLFLDDYDLVYIRSYGFTGQTVPPFSNHSISRSPEVITDVNKFVRKIHVFFTFISGNIVNKNKITFIVHDPFSRFVGTNLVQLGWMYAALNQFRRGLYIHEPLVGARTDNTGGYALYNVFGNNLARVTRECLVDPRLQRVILNGTLQTFFPPFLLHSRSDEQTFDREDPHRALLPIFKDNNRYWIFDYPMISWPLPIAKVLFQFLRLVNKADKVLGGIVIR